MRSGFHKPALACHCHFVVFFCRFGTETGWVCFWNQNFPNPLVSHEEELTMSRHNEMPPVPPANRSNKGTGDHAEVNKDTAKRKGEVNTAEQGDTANIKQNTTNAGFFKGRRVK
jgi:hypothetical protein